MSQQVFHSAPVTREELSSVMLQIADILNGLREAQADIWLRLDPANHPDPLGIEAKIDTLLDGVESFMQKYV